ncbi:hypothetical protein [Mesorhizobium sp. B2-3-2]|uniref:hypothetical protein n=1 Tax=Mesorhizobium sp. B2-3-2 TaxID=2589961 RepID=UPI00112A6174|nr:hypothetical protein [Mesorhizobium sp. B2-3-2]TPM37032.1 hypothetical protein FJ964_30320 [Mesorhizobium sp. B2-3-2]
MSDIRGVENDTKSGELNMRALVDTEGLSVPEKAEFWLHGLAWAKHRGRHDTWTAARDRAAKEAGIASTIAKRIWQRFEGMNDVSGKALLKLMLAYEDACQRNEEAVAAYRAERLNLKAQRHAVDNQRARESVGESRARD